MKKIPFFLITGFLGSGKTTFVKNIIENYADDIKIAIVQNEFAPSNVDSIDLKLSDKSFHILEVNRGSIFCVCLLNDFITSLVEFIDQHSPDILILEASGLADPITIAELVESPILSDKIILSKVYTVVDSSNFDKLKNNSRVIHQIRIADEIIINKIDQSNSILEVEKEIKALNPHANILSSSYCDISVQEFIEPRKSIPIALSNQKFDDFSGSGRPDTVARVLKTNRNFSLNKIMRYLSSLDDNLLRIKGYLNSSDKITLAIQFVFGNLEITEVFNYKGPTLLIAIGNNSYVNETFKELLKISDE